MSDIDNEQEEIKGIWKLVQDRLRYAKKNAKELTNNVFPSEQMAETAKALIDELMNEVQTNFNLLKEQVVWLQQFAQRNIVVIEDGSVSDIVLENFDQYQIPYLVYRQGATAPQILRLTEVDTWKEKNI